MKTNPMDKLIAEQKVKYNGMVNFILRKLENNHPTKEERVYIFKVLKLALEYDIELEKYK